MIKALLTVPILIALLLVVASELEDIAESTADQALAFSADMSNAMPCATLGIPLAECSPELFNYDFTENKEALLEQIEELQNILEDVNFTELNMTEEEYAELILLLS